MSQNSWILRFGELGLKSKSVRGSFQRLLRKNMFELAKNNGITLFHEVIRNQDHVSSPNSVEDVERILSSILGVVAIDRVEKLDCGILPEEVANAVLVNSPNFGKKRTFGVRVKRIAKTGNITSKQYELGIGSEMIRLDSSLSVNLSNPDEWIKLVVEQNHILQIKNRIETCSGLPPGAQGDVLIQINSERKMLEGFLIMRRGVRLIPVLDSKKEFIDLLSNFDPFIGTRTPEHEMQGHAYDRPAWGLIGLSIEEAEPFIGRREEAVKTTPISTLEPLVGWSDKEIDCLMQHFLYPSKNRIHPIISEWIT